MASSTKSLLRPIPPDEPPLVILPMPDFMPEPRPGIRILKLFGVFTLALKNQNTAAGIAAIADKV